MLTSRNRIRRLAARVLLVWLFALATGVVNACIVEPAPRQAAPASTQLRPDALADHSHGASGAGHVHAAAAGHANEHASGGSAQGHKAACMKFCDEPSAGAQNPKSPADPSEGAWLAMPVADALQPAQSWVAVPSRAAAPERWPPATPISIAFLRLTL